MVISHIYQTHKIFFKKIVTINKIDNYLNRLFVLVLLNILKLNGTAHLEGVWHLANHKFGAIHNLSSKFERVVCWTKFFQSWLCTFCLLETYIHLKKYIFNENYIHKYSAKLNFSFHEFFLLDTFFNTWFFIKMHLSYLVLIPYL